MTSATCSDLPRPPCRAIGRRAHPSLVVDNLSHLLNDHIDLAIHFGVPPDSSTVTKQMTDNYRVTCASPSYIAAHDKPTQTDALADLDFIFLLISTKPSSGRRFSRDGKTVNVRVPAHRAHATDGGAVAREWALEGRGIVMKSIWDGAGA
ncbi:LysR substrate-binding domain-containing protein [Burkholderia singularis]|uniref:LysR substrate-binding domain-containing protein n=1 Tax=Burkholderia singularis TaxID=1503053 RepID=UPI0009E97D94|nr:LysR substrate-binding domain-containing protein [Burkholderia singularis]